MCVPWFTGLRASDVISYDVIAKTRVERVDASYHLSCLKFEMLSVLRHNKVYTLMSRLSTLACDNTI